MINTKDAHVAGLLKIVAEKMHDEIKASIREQMEPMVDAAATSVMQSLSLALNQHKDVRDLRSVTQLIINNKEVPHGPRS